MNFSVHKVTRKTKSWAAEKWLHLSRELALEYLCITHSLRVSPGKISNPQEAIHASQMKVWIIYPYCEKHTQFQLSNVSKVSWSRKQHQGRNRIWTRRLQANSLTTLQCCHHTQSFMWCVYTCACACTIQILYIIYNHISLYIYTTPTDNSS